MQSTVNKQQKPSLDRLSLLNDFKWVRKTTENMCRPLQLEDFVVQPTEDVSPPKWHLGHTTWFLETLILSKFLSNFEPFHPIFNNIFNSSFESFGPRVLQPKRGTLSRPSVREILNYRRHVDSHIYQLIQNIPENQWLDFSDLLLLGINHEQQHQERLLTDIKQIFFHNFIRPVYHTSPENESISTSHLSLEPHYVGFEGGNIQMGHEGDQFAWDNEKPLHTIYMKDFKLRNLPVLNGEYIQFIEDGGYYNFKLWLSEGWNLINREGWQAPLYWEKIDDEWMTMTLSGLKKVDPEEPVCHVSYFEADAFARWAGKRLPTEFEWEWAAKSNTANHIQNNFLENQLFHPRKLGNSQTQKDVLYHMMGNVWEWTSSPHLPYPGYKPFAGALEEYNGKFMSNQMVLRGGSCVTPRHHIRLTYRYYLYPDKRWQFCGFRLAGR
jgi:ergothioneine biosynthesis protein EgtB